MLTAPVAAVIGAAVGWACWVAARRLAAGQDEPLVDARRDRVLPVLCAALGGGAMALAALRSGGDAAVLARVVLLGVPLLITLATDLLTRLVFPLVLLPGWLLALGFAAAGPGGAIGPLIASVAAGGVAALLVVLADRVWPDAAETPLGSGEIFIAATAGAILGPQRTLPVLFAGVLLGALAAAVLLIGRRSGRQDVLPYGAFLCGATLVGVAA